VKLRSIPSNDLKRALRGNVFFVGLVSFFTDLSSEMIYPLLPVFLSGITSPASAAVYIGLMDGVGESVASYLKLVSGKWSDRMGRRKPLVFLGYGLSGIARPLMALAAAGWHVVVLRAFDRVGKGVRTSPRDALLSESVEADVRGLAFSFHRVMDHAGAVLGPAVAATFLYAMIGGGLLWQTEAAGVGAREVQALRWLFALALVPGIAAAFVVWRGVREAPVRSPARTAAAPSVPLVGNDAAKSPADRAVCTGATATTPLPRRFVVFVAAATLFTLGNSSDLFLIFYAQTRFGFGAGWLMVLWMTLHLAKIAFSLPGGRLSDRAGRRTAIAVGWALYAAIYACVAFVSDFRVLFVLLVLYGAYYGMTEGAERALVADVVPAGERGRAYGIYHAAVGFAALPASAIFGVMWAQIGPHRAFLLGAVLAAAALVVLLFTGTGPGAPRRRTQPPI